MNIFSYIAIASLMYKNRLPLIGDIKFSSSVFHHQNEKKAKNKKKQEKLQLEIPYKFESTMKNRMCYKTHMKV